MTLKKNILILATHGSYKIPWFFRQLLAREFRKENYRLLKNFSDFATAELVGSVQKDQRIISWFSRAIGDPNRSPDSDYVFSDKDFNDIPIWKWTIPDLVKRYWSRNNYQKYHLRIQKKIDAIERTYDEVVILDIHDTGIYLLNSKGKVKRKGGFPGICLSNYDNQTSTKGFIMNLAKLFKIHVGINPTINSPYKGGYVTQKYGIGHPNRQVIQVEFSRDLYMDENSQVMDKKKMATLKSGFKQVLSEI